MGWDVSSSGVKAAVTVASLVIVVAVALAIYSTYSVVTYTPPVQTEFGRIRIRNDQTETPVVNDARTFAQRSDVDVYSDIDWGYKTFLGGTTGNYATTKFAECRMTIPAATVVNTATTMNLGAPVKDDASEGVVDNVRTLNVKAPTDGRYNNHAIYAEGASYIDTLTTNALTTTSTTATWTFTSTAWPNGGGTTTVSFSRVGMCVQLCMRQTVSASVTGGTTDGMHYDGVLPADLRPSIAYPIPIMVQRNGNDREVGMLVVRATTGTIDIYASVDHGGFDPTANAHGFDHLTVNFYLA